jgi:hypothetical protein
MTVDVATGTSGEASTGVSDADEWRDRLAAIAAEAVARRERERATRAEFAARRRAGKAARHAARLRAARPTAGPGADQR